LVHSSTMASIQEQLRQIKDVSDDMLDENTRIVNLLSDAAQEPSHEPSIAGLPNTAGDADGTVVENIESQPS